jgi:hypothetical protein
VGHANLLLSWGSTSQILGWISLRMLNVSFEVQKR